MNKEQMIDILEALDAGDPVEYKLLAEIIWHPMQMKTPNFGICCYRRKPAPLESWINVYPHETVSLSYETKQKAESCVGDNAIRTAVHVREVIENE